MATVRMAVIEEATGRVANVIQYEDNPQTEAQKYYPPEGFILVEDLPRNASSIEVAARGRASIGHNIWNGTKFVEQTEDNYYDSPLQPGIKHARTERELVKDEVITVVKRQS